MGLSRVYFSGSQNMSMHGDKFKLANFCSAQQMPGPQNALQNIVDGEPPDGDVNHDGLDEPPDLDEENLSDIHIVNYCQVQPSPSFSLTGLS